MVPRQFMALWRRQREIEREQWQRSAIVAAAVSGGKLSDFMPAWAMAPLRPPVPEPSKAPDSAPGQGNAFMSFASMMLGVPLHKEEASQ